ncbi:unnamed protein product [Paramecium octaurelia]|uniref:Transmembrane protein n=1 Tax=Paramecium octaurelia TaxID=43137 RepID=A0A8S1XAG3_PAROT|nr:unnamed protein product [Paramecium octaurelia]
MQKFRQNSDQTTLILSEFQPDHQNLIEIFYFNAKTSLVPIYYIFIIWKILFTKAPKSNYLMKQQEVGHIKLSFYFKDITMIQGTCI